MIKINRVEIKNVGQIENAVLDNLPNGLYLTGRLAQGKSTILNCVRLAFFKRCEFTAQNGSGALGWIRKGEDFAMIEVKAEIEDHPYTFVVQMDDKVQWQVVDDIANVKAAKSPKEFWKKIFGAMERVELCMAFGQYIDGAKNGNDDFGKVLAEFLSGAIPLSRILDAMPEQADFLREFLKVIEAPAEETIQHWRWVGQRAGDVRKETAAVLKEHQNDFESLQFSGVPKRPDGSYFNVNDIQSCKHHINALGAEIDKLNRELGAAESAPVISDDAREMMETDMKAHADGIAENQTAIEKSLTALTDIQGQIRELSGTQRAMVEEMIDLQNALTSARADHAAWDATTRKNQDKCSKCGQTIPASLIEEWGQKSKSLIVDLEPKVDALQARMDKNADDVRALRTVEETTSDEIRRLKNAMADHANAKHKIEQQLEQAKQVHRDSNVINAEIGAARNQMEKGDKIVAALEIMVNRESAKKNIARLTEKVEHLKAIEDAFVKGVVLNELTDADLRSQIVATANEALEPFNHYLDLQPDGKKFSVLFARSGETLRHLWDSSKGQNVLAQIAVCTAIGQIVGAPVLIDNCDGLDGNARQIALQLLKHSEQTIVMAGTWPQSKAPTVDELSNIQQSLDPALLVWVAGNTVNVAASKSAA